MIEPYKPAPVAEKLLVARPSTQAEDHHRHIAHVIGQILRGTDYALHLGGERLARAESPYLAAVVVPGLFVVFADARLFLRIGDDEPLPALLIAAGWRLQGDFNAAPDHIAVDGSGQIESFAHAARGLEDVVY